ncbi:two-component sensor histidine kinase [Legionella lansingensis]|uniref:histidine kinase n=1 Tax=Legionella lansingensis TaxID=45067 RepID=A0A0W0W1Q9_9GAMM|nr:ATP-binding protein [Legionella lansingensis]KTD26110.1 two-component sensor histidine kinase [Legionella lansingensis]SNV52605.1 two-component sensor histidine kinase [Legionella lansingensis]
MSVMEAIDNFFQTQGFMPHGMCLLWKPAILWTMVIGNAVTALAYFIIPIALIYLILKRRDIGFKWMFVLFGLFILACGLTHVMSIVTLWKPMYGLEALVLAFTGIVSLLTAILIWPLLPILFKIPSPWQLEKMNEALNQSNKELDDFAYIASHDLKEPLRGINNFSSFLLEDYYDKLDEEGKEQLNTLKRLSQRMEALINDLLIYSRAGRAELVYQPCNLNEVVENKLQLLDSYLKENNANVIIKRPLPMIVCDKARVGEIFHNLIVNAIKYNNSEEKTVTIDFKEANDHYVFSIEDNGIGIAAEHFDNIFKIFKRLHGRDEYGGGTGLGLTLIKKIIERHKGKIWLDSQVDKGTTFYFSIIKALKPGNEVAITELLNGNHHG